MTGVTSELAPWQVDELREYADGPLRPARRPTALLRRGMLMSVGKYGETAYAITEFGRAALAAASRHETDLEIVRNYLDWQFAIYGGHESAAFHQVLVMQERPRPTLDEARAALDRVEGRAT